MRLVIENLLLVSGQLRKQAMQEQRQKTAGDNDEYPALERLQALMNQVVRGQVFDQFVGKQNPQNAKDQVGNDNSGDTAPDVSRFLVHAAAHGRNYSVSSSE
jgi:hypothetical protein